MNAIALISGGLDSLLAAKVIKDQGINVTGLHFEHGYSTADYGKAFKVPEQIGVQVEIIDIRQEFLEILSNPAHGFGKSANPCIDCHAFMLKKAGKEMTARKAEFIVTGEVLGQRPMSQTLPALKLIEKESGLSDRLLRPLSAKLLPETLPERTGWVDRTKLFDFRGRTRHGQIELAVRSGIEIYPQPAGGCLLTDENIGRRVRDILKHRRITVEDAELVRLGRHFRVAENVKVIVGRNLAENESLAAHKTGRVFLDTDSHKGPSALIEGNADGAALQTAGQLIARFSDAAKGEKVTFNVENIGRMSTFTVKNDYDESIISKWRV